MAIYLDLARRYRLLLLLSVLVGVLAGCMIVLATPSRWAATSSSYVYTSSAQNLSDLNQGSSYAQDITKSYATIVKTGYVLAPVIAKLGITYPIADLADDIQVNVPVDTSILEITASASTAAGAQRLSNALAAQLPRSAAALTQREDSGQSPILVTQVNAATEVVQTQPKVLLTIIASIASCLVLGILILSLREALRTRYQNAEEIEDATGIAALGNLAYQRGIANAPLARVAQRELDVEQYNQLRTGLTFLNASSGSTTFLVTSPGAGEGKTTTVANLAVALGEAGLRTLVVDADLRRPNVASTFGLDGAIGLTDVLKKDVTLSEAIQVWNTSNVAILPAGVRPPNPSELLQSNGFEKLIKDAQDEWDYVLIDAPPVLPVTDALLIARLVHDVLLVSSALHTKRSAIRATIAAFDRMKLIPRGSITTNVRSASSKYGYSHYGSYS